MPKAFVDIANARKGEYKKVIEAIAETRQCPFCPENFKYPIKTKGEKEIHLFAYHKKPIYKTKGGWFLTNNSWPYKNTGCHLLIIGKKHKENFSELTQKDLTEVNYLTNFAVKKWKIKGGAVCMRFGKTKFTGASVSHIHFHIISPQIDEKTRRARVVKFPIG